jgi:hypothetical protein
MMIGHRARQRRRTTASGDPSEWAPGDGFVISVSGGLHDGPCASLADLLGTGYRVVVDVPEGAAVAVVGPVGPFGVAFLRARYPHTALVVVDHHHDATAGRAALYLDAGADAYESERSAAAIAAHVKALTRRTSANQP